MSVWIASLHLINHTPVFIEFLSSRYEFRRSAALSASRAARGAPSMEEVEAMKKDRQFQLEVDWIKALPGENYLSILYNPDYDSA